MVRLNEGDVDREIDIESDGGMSDIDGKEIDRGRLIEILDSLRSAHEINRANHSYSSSL